MHSAPGHGEDDYNLLSAIGVAPYSPVDDEGRFTADVKPLGLLGLPVLDAGTLAVINMLRREGGLIHRHSYKHKYPYDWRSKTPVIVRATEQWFANVGGLRGDAIKAIQNTDMVPDSCMFSPLFVMDKIFLTMGSNRAVNVICAKSK